MSSIFKGKSSEYFVYSRLMEAGFDIYPAIVDDKGIDCIIRLDENKYLDIQIKSSSKDANQPRNFAYISTFEPRENYFFIFQPGKENDLWILPSSEVVKRWTLGKKGNEEGKFNITVPNLNKEKEFNQFKNEKGFELLRKL